MTSKRTAATRIVLPLIAVTALFAATSATIIGMASSQNSSTLTLDNSRVSGNATLFDGSTVEASGYARLQLTNGTRMDLSAGSKAKVFANRTALDRGMTEIKSATGFEVDAGFVKVHAGNPDALARVKVDGKTVYVTAVNSPVEVVNPAGLLVARVSPGSPMSFMPQTGKLTAFESTGCVLEKSGAAVIVDNNGNQTFELRDADLRKVVGNQAHITGTVDLSATPVSGALQVVKVGAANITAKGGCSSAAAALDASTAPGAKSPTGPAAGAIATPLLVLLIVGGATAVSLGAAAAAGAFNSSP